MEVASIPRRASMPADFRRWAWWQLPAPLRAYVGAVPFAAAVLIGYAAATTSWHPADLLKFLLIEACGVASVGATPRTAYLHGGMIRDFITAWVLPVAILLPPIYAMAAPVPLLVITQVRIHKGVMHRRVFSAAALSLAYGGASLVFRAFPTAFAGAHIGSGVHALEWILAVAVSEIVGGRGDRLLLLFAMKLSDPSVRFRDEVLAREALQADLAESNLGLVVTIVVGVNPLFAILVVPTWMLVRRYMVHPDLVEQSRTDVKTGLLNASTWEREAAAEVDRAVRTKGQLAVALIDIDHFKKVNDTYGHLAGDRALKAVSQELRNHLRGYDLAGRFGGEEFVLLLPEATGQAASHIAERLRTHIAGMVTPVNDDPDCDTFVTLTISIGVAALDGASRKLSDLMATADTALYHAKHTGRNRTHVISASIPNTP
jgi:diguanylate cyclase (GGDEF)-like protein